MPWSPPTAKPLQIVRVEFPADEYYPEICIKRQIIGHYSAGRDNARQMFEIWDMDYRVDKATGEKKTRRVACPLGMGDDGIVYQGYDERCYAGHIGLTEKNSEWKFANKLPLGLIKYLNGPHSTMLEKQSIGLEICNGGPLTKTDRGWETWFKQVIPEEKIQFYEKPFRGFKAFEKFTSEEINSTWLLYRKLCKEHDIPTTYNEDMWDLSERAIRGDAGIWTHVAFTTTRADWHPQPEMIEMLKAL